MERVDGLLVRAQRVYVSVEDVASCALRACATRTLSSSIIWLVIPFHDVCVMHHFYGVPEMSV